MVERLGGAVWGEWSISLSAAGGVFVLLSVQDNVSATSVYGVTSSGKLRRHDLLRLHASMNKQKKKIVAAS